MNSYKEKDYPILDYDDDKGAIIRPYNLVKKLDIAEYCVLTFFASELDEIIKKYPSKIIEYFKIDAYKIPIYEIEYDGEKIVLVQAMVGSPVAARQIEDLVEMGCKKFIVCGDCGVLEESISVGMIILPFAAVRDEGTSYHYVKPSNEINMNKDVLNILEKYLIENKVQYIKTKTWTTDAFYRETKKKIIKRKNEGCLAVEMEASTYMAVSEFNEVKLGLLMYASDSLSSSERNRRKECSSIINRGELLKIAIQSCLIL